MKKTKNSHAEWLMAAGVVAAVVFAVSGQVIETFAALVVVIAGLVWAAVAIGSAPRDVSFDSLDPNEGMRSSAPAEMELIETGHPVSHPVLAFTLPQQISGCVVDPFDSVY